MANSITATVVPLTSWKLITLLCIYFGMLIIYQSLNLNDHTTMKRESNTGMFDLLLPANFFGTSDTNRYLHRIDVEGKIQVLMKTFCEYMVHSPISFTWMLLLTLKLFYDRKGTLCDTCIGFALATFLVDVLQSLMMIIMIVLYPNNHSLQPISIAYTAFSGIKWFFMSCYFILVGTGIWNTNTLDRLDLKSPSTPFLQPVLK